MLSMIRSKYTALVKLKLGRGAYDTTGVPKPSAYIMGRGAYDITGITKPVITVSGL